jgi:hypothetical protein
MVVTEGEHLQAGGAARFEQIADFVRIRRRSLAAITSCR